VREYAWFYRCEPKPGAERPPRVAKSKKRKKGEPAPVEVPSDDCPLRLWKDTSGRYIDRSSVSTLLRDGKTGVLEGFVARGGRSYKGHLEIDHDEWRVRVFSEGWSEDLASEVPEYEVNTEPLGACPQSGECAVVETPTQFACTTRLQEEEQQAAFREARRAAREKGEEPPPKPEPPDHPGLALPRTVCKREITRDEALVYLRDRKTELLTDFTSRFGRPFSAQLVLKENGRHGFEFPPRAAGEGRGRKKPPRKSEEPKLDTTPRTVVRARKKGGRRSAARSAGAGRKRTRRAVPSAE
jgi:DNA topoisomerase-3